MKSYALTPVRFTGRPPENGKPHITPAISAIFTAERNYVADVPVEEAARAVRNWPMIYEYLKPEDADAENVIGKLTEENEELKHQNLGLRKELDALKKKRPGGRPRKAVNDNVGVGQSLS